MKLNKSFYMLHSKLINTVFRNISWLTSIMHDENCQESNTIKPTTGKSFDNN